MWRFDSWRRDVIVVLLSIAIHAVLAIVLLLLAREEPPPERERDVVAISIRPKPPGATPKPPELSGQVVDLPRPDRERLPPKDARFLSRWNIAVDRERKARLRGPRDKGEPESGGKPAGNAGAGRGTLVEGSGGKLQAGEGSEPTLRGAGGLDKLLLPTGDGMGLARNTRGLSGGYVSDDALLGVQEEGDTTLVNSRSFKYFDFFQRVKEQVRAEWNPADVYRARDPYGKVFGTRDRLTILTVVLDSEGRIVSLSVERRSGLPFLDEEALRAFRQAGPFPNPPKGLADEHGRIAFNFGFLLEMSSSRFNMFWQRPE